MNRHRFHALCPYFAMFPETFVEKWLARLTKLDDAVLDPFAGRGTTAFQSLLMGRRALTCDTNAVAYCVTRAKTNAPGAAALRKRLTFLERMFVASDYTGERESLPVFFRYAYHPWTLGQMLHLRRHLRWRRSDVDCMLAAVTLGILHGDSEKSSSYLSCQMPRTISTKPAYSVRFWQERRLDPPWRNAFDAVRKQITFRYESDPPRSVATVFHADMRDLPRLLGDEVGRIRHVITSPPYFDVTNFEEDQWLRLWFLGGPPAPTRNRLSPDDRYSDDTKYWRFIGDMWRTLGLVLGRGANIIIRIGATAMEPGRIVQMLAASAVFAQRKVQLIDDEVSEIRGRQTDIFRPGSRGCLVEVDCHLKMY